MYNPESRERGTEFEYDVFGQVDIRNPAFKKAMAEAGADPRGYLKYRQAMELAKRFQPGDPQNPKKEFSRDLRIEVADLLGVPYESVAVFTAVKTPLDVFHGVDGFLTVKVGNQEFVVTMDASLRDKEPDEVKADVLVNRLPDPNLQEDEYITSVDQFSEIVAGLVGEQIERAKRERGGRTHPAPEIRASE